MATERPSQGASDVVAGGATLLNAEEVRRYIMNSAIALYNATPQAALGESPNNIETSTVEDEVWGTRKLMCGCKGRRDRRCYLT